MATVSTQPIAKPATSRPNTLEKTPLTLIERLTLKHAQFVGGGRRSILVALVVFWACQLLTTVMMYWVWRTCGPFARGQANESYLGFLSVWDSEWYRRVAEDGYPTALPYRRNGRVMFNTWAFYPLFPKLAQFGVNVTGWDFTVVGLIITFIAATATAALLYVLLKPRVGHTVAVWSVALLGSFVSAATLQVPYADALSLAGLLALMWAMRRGSYGLAAVIVIALGLTRPIGVPVAIMVLVHCVLAVRRELAGKNTWEELNREKLLRLVALSGTAMAMAMAWQVYADWKTQTPGLYYKSQSAWRSGVEFSPFRQWFEFAYEQKGFLGYLIIIAIMGLIAWTMLGRHAARLPFDMRVWTLTYATYLLAVGSPNTSIWRHMLLLFPILVVAVQGLRSWRPRLFWLILGFATQYWWISYLWGSQFRPP